MTKIRQTKPTMLPESRVEGICILLGLQTDTSATGEHCRWTQPRKEETSRPYNGYNEATRAPQWAGEEERAGCNTDHRVPHGVLGWCHAQTTGEFTRSNWRVTWRCLKFLCWRFHVSTSLNVYIPDLEAETSPFYVLKSLGLAFEWKRHVWWCPVVPSFWTPILVLFKCMQARFTFQLKLDLKWVAFLYWLLLSEVYYFLCEERVSFAHGL